MCSWSPSYIHGHLPQLSLEPHTCTRNRRSLRSHTRRARTPLCPPEAVHVCGSRWPHPGAGVKHAAECIFERPDLSLISLQHCDCTLCLPAGHP